MAELPTLETFRHQAEAWLDTVTVRRAPVAAEWGHGDDSVVVFDNWTESEEAAMMSARRSWEHQRFDAGWGAITWAEHYGGKSLPARYAEAYTAAEAGFVTPRRTELFDVTQLMVAPTIEVWGTPTQRETFIRALLRAELLCCQLFSEPGAGSDLAGVGTKAVADGSSWILEGQKVWTSGARSAEWGLAICRSDSTVAKHAGMTAFMVPMDAPGVAIRPIRQMTGGASFNEVFLDGVRLDDSLRLGPVGAGWKVALTVLASERASSGSLGGGSVAQVMALARAMGRHQDPVLRQALADLYIHTTVDHLNVARVVESLAAGQTPGPEGSIGRLSATRNLTRGAQVVAALLGPRLCADTGEWGTFAWNEHVLGAPGYRIAGGSDEIQHNIIGERVLGLAREPR
jgi:alkylation response protein AidB-like acyl-CoA dehydrogenase